MRAALLAAAAVLAACGPATEPPAAGRRLAGAPETGGYSVSPGFDAAAWVEGVWPDRTTLAVLDLASGRVARRRLKGYSLVETAFAPDGGLKVLARKVNASDSPGAPPRRAAVLAVPADGGQPVVEEDGVVADRRPAPWHAGPAPKRRYATAGEPSLLARGPRGAVWVASMAADGSTFVVESFDEADGSRRAVIPVPGPVESMLPLDDALFLLTRSSESLPTASDRGPRRLTKVDLRAGRETWSVPWAPRRSAVLARDPRGTLYASVTDPEAPSLWAFPDRADAARATGAAAAAPGAARGKGLRTAGHFLARLLPALLLGTLVFLLRR
ncbi:MAG: hypothetical protein SF051_14900 [Elusimicrobiota bacterium]|nr:hypothetical protein [Elusimicrobiota bacterium]